MSHWECSHWEVWSSIESGVVLVEVALAVGEFVEDLMNLKSVTLPWSQLMTRIWQLWSFMVLWSIRCWMRFQHSWRRIDSIFLSSDVKLGLIMIGFFILLLLNKTVLASSARRNLTSRGLGQLFSAENFPNLWMSLIGDSPILVSMMLRIGRTLSRPGESWHFEGLSWTP